MHSAAHRETALQAIGNAKQVNGSVRIEAIVIGLVEHDRRGRRPAPGAGGHRDPRRIRHRAARCRSEAVGRHGAGLARGGHRCHVDLGVAGEPTRVAGCSGRGDARWPRFEAPATGVDRLPGSACWRSVPPSRSPARSRRSVGSSGSARSCSSSGCWRRARCWPVSPRTSPAGSCAGSAWLAAFAGDNVERNPKRVVGHVERTRHRRAADRIGHHHVGGTLKAALVNELDKLSGTDLLMVADSSGIPPDIVATTRRHRRREGRGRRDLCHRDGRRGIGQVSGIDPAAMTEASGLEATAGSLADLQDGPDRGARHRQLPRRDGRRDVPREAVKIGDTVQVATLDGTTTSSRWAPSSSRASTRPSSTTP